MDALTKGSIKFIKSNVNNVQLNVNLKREESNQQDVTTSAPSNTIERYHAQKSPSKNSLNSQQLLTSNDNAKNSKNIRSSSRSNSSYSPSSPSKSKHSSPVKHPSNFHPNSKSIRCKHGNANGSPLKSSPKKKSRSPTVSPSKNAHDVLGKDEYAYNHPNENHTPESEVYNLHKTSTFNPNDLLFMNKPDPDAHSGRDALSPKRSFEDKYRVEKRNLSSPRVESMSARKQPSSTYPATITASTEVPLANEYFTGRLQNTSSSNVNGNPTSTNPNQFSFKKDSLDQGYTENTFNEIYNKYVQYVDSNSKGKKNTDLLEYTKESPTSIRNLVDNDKGTPSHSNYNLNSGDKELSSRSLFKNSTTHTKHHPDSNSDTKPLDTFYNYDPNEDGIPNTYSRRDQSDANLSDAKTSPARQTYSLSTRVNDSFEKPKYVVGQPEDVTLNQLYDENYIEPLSSRRVSNGDTKTSRPSPSIGIVHSKRKLQQNSKRGTNAKSQMKLAVIDETHLNNPSSSQTSSKVSMHKSSSGTKNYNTNKHKESLQNGQHKHTSTPNLLDSANLNVHSSSRNVYTPTNKNNMSINSLRSSRRSRDDSPNLSHVLSGHKSRVKDYNVMSEVVHLRNENSGLLKTNEALRRQVDQYEKERATIDRIKQHYQEILDAIRTQEQTLAVQRETIRQLKEDNSRLRADKELHSRTSRLKQANTERQCSSSSHMREQCEHHRLVSDRSSTNTSHVLSSRKKEQLHLRDKDDHHKRYVSPVQKRNADKKQNGNGTSTNPPNTASTNKNNPNPNFSGLQVKSKFSSKNKILEISDLKKDYEQLMNKYLNVLEVEQKVKNAERSQREHSRKKTRM